MPSSVTSRVSRSSRPVEDFGVATASSPGGQGQPFHQRHQIDAALFQHGAAGQVHAMHLEIGQPVADLRPRPHRNEARSRQRLLPSRRSRLAG